ncbi:MAG: hypothetical protein AAF570_07880, partial [Bacteroidota bacterium]
MVDGGGGDAVDLLMETNSCSKKYGFERNSSEKARWWGMRKVLYCLMRNVSQYVIWAFMCALLYG